MLPLGKEFRIIQQFFASHASYDSSVVCGIGDDAAVIVATPGMEQVISVDTSIANRHFPADADPFDIACRSLNVSLSDLAAMGAKARWFTLALSLPDVDEAWLERFAEGLFVAASRGDVMLIGGDTTRGPLAVTIQVQGEVHVGKALLRSGAQVDDYIYISGYLGDAGAGLAVQQNRLPRNEALLKAYLLPEPELTLGLQLGGKANSCIDVSDGLLADLAHILRASGVGAEIDLEKLPLSPAILTVLNKEKALELALTAGDDYKLCFTSSLSPENIHIDNIFCIGRIIPGDELQLINKPECLQVDKAGFDHFNE